MSQEMKANILIYTETNRSFIQEKVYDEFRYECLKDEELKDLDVDKMVRTLKKIYDFGEGNPYMRAFFARAPDNIHKFIALQYKTTSETQDLVIDIGKLIDVIFACIEDGFDKQTKPTSEQKVDQKPQKEKAPSPIEQKVVEEAQEKEAQKVKKFYVPKPKTPEKKNFIEKYEMPQKKMPARYLLHMGKQVRKQKQAPVQAQVEPLDAGFMDRNKAILQARLEDLFHHYCSQQQNLGQHATFDRIKSECSQMTVGKFLLFCKVSKIFNDNEMAKQILISKFKKVAEGKKQIQFDQFKDLLMLLDQQYIRIKKKNASEDDKIPTFQARLMLQGQDYKKLKKDIDLPFYTREKEGRELKQYATIESSRYSKKDELTSHSGKFGKDLRLEVERKLVAHSVNSKSKGDSKKKIEGERIIRLGSIRNQNLPSMDWIMQDDEEDKTFMREYRARDVVGELKKRVSDLSKIQQNNNH